MILVCALTALLAWSGTGVAPATPPSPNPEALKSELLARGVPPGLVLIPTTTDPAVAQTWLRGYTTSGMEGVVAKHAHQP